MRFGKRVTGHQILFLVSFFIGILIVTILARGKVPENTLMDQSLSSVFLGHGWNQLELFFQCLLKRGTILFFIMLLTCTSMRRWVFYTVIVWIGLVFGAMLKLFYLWYGIKGMGLLIVSVLPHYIFYWMAYGFLYWEFEKKRMIIRKNKLSVFLALGVVIMGIFLESYVNPFFVSGYLKLFF